MQRDVGTVEHGQQLGLVGMQPREQAVEGNEARAATEDATEADAKLTAAGWRWAGAVGFQVGVEVPDQRADMLLRGPLLIGESIELMHQPLGVYPTHRMLTDCELPGVIADDDRVTQKLMRVDAAPQRPLG